MNQITRELSAARLRAAHFFPYFATMIHRLIPIQSTQIPTMAVDRWWRLIYNPDFTAKLSVDEAAWVLIHEVMHLFREHHRRCRDNQFDPKLYNFAADFAINDDLLQMDGIKAPQGVLLPEDFGLQPHLLEEQYYRVLAEVEGRVRAEVERLIAEGRVMPGAGRSGSCATGHREEWEPAEPGEPGAPEGMSPTIADLVRGKVAQEILDYATKHPGNVPGNLVRFAEELLNPQVPWQTKLRSYVRQSVHKVTGNVDFASPPRRRDDGSSPFMLPAMKGGICNVAVVVDTSGSMTARQLGQALAEIRGITQAMQNMVAITVLSVDAAVSQVKRVLRPKQVQLFGGGGTDMGQGVYAAADCKPRPDVIVVLTDGYTDWPESAPPGIKRTIVVVLTEDGESPSWADTVRVFP